MIYLVVGVDQEGDACWDVKQTLDAALAVHTEMSECAFDGCIKVYSVETTANTGDELRTTEIKT